MTAFFLGPLGRLRPLDLVQRGASAQVSRASSSLVTLGGARHIQSAPRGLRDWSLSLGQRRDASLVAHLAACASGALPGPLFLYAGDAARTNLFPADVAAPCQVGSSALGSVAGSVLVGMPSGVESLTGVVQQSSAGAWSATIPVRSQVAYVLSAWGSAAGALIEWRTVSAGGVPISSGTLSAAAAAGGFYGAVEVASGTAAGLQVRLAAGSRTVGGLRLVEGVLPTSGAITRRNLVPNPSFEVDTTGPLAGPGVAYLIAAPGETPAGVNRLSVFGSNPAQAWTANYLNTTLDYAPVAGQWVAAAVRVRRSGSVGLRLSLALQFRSGTTQVSVTPTTFVPLTPDSLLAPSTLYTVVAQVPPGVDNARILMNFGGTSSGGTPIDGWLAHTDAWIAAAASTESEALAQVADYFDGSTAPEPHRCVAWDGTPHASSSTERILPDDATWPGWVPGRGVPQVVVDDPTETLQLVTTREILADYTVTIREVG